MVTQAPALLDLMQSLLTQAVSFRDLLLQEQQHLVHHDLDNLAAISQTKLPLIESLEQGGQHFASLLGQLNPAALEQTIAELPAEYQAAARALWEPLKDTLSECERLNLINGMAILAAKNEEAKLLNTLLGQPHQPSTYNKKGGVER